MNFRLVVTSLLCALTLSPTLFASRQGVESHWMIPLRKYLLLSGSERVEYTTKLRREYLAFEKSAAGQTKYADHKAFRILPAEVALWFAFVPEASAAAPAGTCVVGGVIRPLVRGHCPTFGRSCGSGGDSFLCGKVYGGACVARTPLDSLSERCDQNAGTGAIPPDAYRETKAIIEQNLNKACPNTPNAQKSCTFLRDRLAKLNQGYTKPEPSPKPPVPLPTPKPTPAPAKGKFSAADGDTCKKDRDQGQNGTCHAFCLTCVYDQALKAKTKQTSRVSANWIAMLSVVERLCDDPGSAEQMSDDVMRKGWYPQKNLNLLSFVGACQEKTFLPYSNREGADWAKGFSGMATRGLNSRPLFNDAHWSQQFGLKAQDAYDLYCPSQGQSIEKELSGYRSRLEKMKTEGKLSDKFYSCAKEAAENAKKLAGGEPHYGTCDAKMTSGTPEEKVQALKDLLKKEGRPVPVVISTDVEGHGFHCVTATGYDDAKKEFQTTNSWGSSQQYSSIPYNGLGGAQNLVQVFPTTCAFGGGASGGGSAPDPTSTPAATAR